MDANFTRDIEAVPCNPIDGHVAKHWGKHHLIVDGRVVFIGTEQDCHVVMGGLILGESMMDAVAFITDVKEN